MSSSEEYLDNLLKTLLGNENNTEEDQQKEGQDSPEAMLSTIGEITAKESNKAMSTDEIEEMFASMGGSIVTSASGGQEEPEQPEEPVPDNWALEEDLLSEESEEPELPGLDSWALEEDLLPEEPEQSEQAEESEPDNWALEEDLLPEKSEKPELSGLDSWALEEDLLPEESEEPELSGLDSWALEEDLLPEKSEKPELSGLDSWALEEDLLPEEPEQAEESEPDNWALEEELLSEEPEELEQAEILEPDGRALEEELLPDSMEAQEMPVSEDISYGKEESSELKEWDLEEEILTEDTEADLQSGLEDWGLEEESLPEQMIEETTTEDENTLSEFGTEEEELALTPETGADVSEDMALTDLEADASTGSTMSEEEVERLLGDDFALEESGEDDEGLSELLESMGHDEDLSEINDLLEKADRGLMEDDDMMSLLGNPLADETEENNDVFDFWGQEEQEDIPHERIKEIVPKENGEENSGKKRKKKKEKKGKKTGKKNMKGGAEQGNAGEGQENKKGFFARLLEFLLEDEEDFPEDNAEGAYDGGAGLGSLTEENAELLAELNAEDKKNSAKKDKKKKAPKKKDKKKDKKPKKAQKPKKPKKEKKADAEENGVPEKKISRTKIVFVCLFCASVAACIIVVNMFIPDHIQKQEAREMYEDGRYEETYGLLYGKELNAEEAALLQKSNIILQIRQKLQSYETYHKLDMQSEALNTLIEGVERYQMFRVDAEQYGVTSEIEGIYTQILSVLSENYGLSEADALDILASESDLIYSEKIYGIINGTGWESVEDTDEEQPEVKQDVLPEEEEIIDRLDNPEVAE